MSPGVPASQLDVEALATEVADFLTTVPVAEGAGAKLSRLLHGFLEAEVLPQATRAADLGLDPTPFLTVVSDVLRLYAEALERPDGGPLSDHTVGADSPDTGDVRTSDACDPRDKRDDGRRDLRGALMGTARYAFRVRGPASDAVRTALQEGLEAEVDATTTSMQGWLPDQAAVSGILARIRLLGLELIEVRRLPQSR